MPKFNKEDYIRALKVYQEYANSGVSTIDHPQWLEHCINNTTCSHSKTHIENLTSGSICDDCGEEL